LHSTHRLFLGERAVYILVWCGENSKKCTKDEIHPLSYWLDYIADFGRKSVVLLVENVIDGNFSNEFPDDTELLQLIAHYKTRQIDLIPTHHRIDCKHNTFGVKSFKDTIKNAIELLQDEYPIIDYPANWYAFQQAIEQKKQAHKKITLNRYYELAKPFNLSNPKALLEHFNDTGVLGYFPKFNNLVVLQMNWVLDAIYAGLKLKDNPLALTRGKLNDSHFKLIWQDYSTYDRELFKAYMLKSNLMAEPTFRKQKREYKYLIPALFEKLKARYWTKWNEKEQYVAVRFNFVFSAIMQQLQVRILSHCHYEDEESFYQNHISFIDEHSNEAFIEMITDKKELRIFSKSDKLTHTILNEVNNIYPLERVALLQRSKGVEEKDFKFNTTNNQLFDSKIKDSIEEENLTNQKNKNMKKPNLFVTYSWSDKDGKLNESHQNRVGRFVNQLIETWGFETSFDLYEEESNFIKMMYNQIENSDKVLIVLSEGYAAKANIFKQSGVEVEYTAIINDIKENPNKYILVAFDSRNGDIYPFGFKGNDTILIKGDLVFNNKPEEQNRLLSKLIDDPIRDKPRTGKRTPKVEKKKF